MEKKDVDRINELARKMKSVGLTEDELEEQKRLRAQYLKEFRDNMKATLENTYLMRPDGTKEKLKQKPVH